MAATTRRQPRSLASCTARCPTPLAAPVIITDSSGWRAAVVSVVSATCPLRISATACTAVAPGGIRLAMIAGATARSVYDPVKVSEVTRSPTAKPVTSGPTSITSPATSPPSTPGSGDVVARVERTDGRVTPIASTRTSSSPGPGVGSAAVS
jgi:hypothetical protein